MYYGVAVAEMNENAQGYLYIPNTEYCLSPCRAPIRRPFALFSCCRYPSTPSLRFPSPSTVETRACLVKCERRHSLKDAKLPILILSSGSVVFCYPARNLTELETQTRETKTGQAVASLTDIGGSPEGILAGLWTTSHVHSGDW